MRARLECFFYATCYSFPQTRSAHPEVPTMVKTNKRSSTPIRFLVPADKQDALLEYYKSIARGSDLSCYAEIVRPRYRDITYYGAIMHPEERAVVLVFEHIKNSAAFVNGAINACPWALFHRT